MKKSLCIILLLYIGILCSLSGVEAKTVEEYQEEIQMLKERNTYLEDRLEEVTAEFKQADLTVKALKKQIDMMALEAEAQTQEVKDTREAMKQVKEQLTALLEQQEESKVTQLEQQLSTALQRIQQLEKDIQNATSENKTQQKTISQLEQEKAKADSERDKAKTALEKATAKADPDKFQQELTNLQTELEKQREQLKATVKLLQDRETELTDAQASIDTLKKQLAAAKAPKDVDRRVEELEAMLADVNARLIRVAQEKTNLETQLQQTSQQKGQVQQKDAEIARLEGELRKAAEYINSRTAEIVELTEEKTALETRLGELSTNKDGVETRLTKSLDERSRKILQLESDVKRLEASLENAESRQRETEKKAAEAAQKAQELDEKLQHQSSVPDAAKVRIQELTQELQDVKVQFENQERLKKEYPVLQQDIAACREQVAMLTQAEERCQVLRTDLQERQLTLERLKKELDAVTTVNLELQAQVKKTDEMRTSQAQECRDSIVRSQELEQQYAQNLEELALKEQVLQQTLTDKALLEKKIDEEDVSFEALRTKLRQAEVKNLALQGELLTLRKTQDQIVQNQHGATSAQVVLQQQLLQEKTLRRQVEKELSEVRKQIRTSQLQKSTAAVPAQPVSRPIISGGSGLLGSMQAFFPQEIIRSTSGETLALLGSSPDKSRRAYQESSGQTERLWIFNTRTQQMTRILEWKTPEGQPASRFAWASDNEHFLFATGIPGRYGLYLGKTTGTIGQPVLLGDYAAHFAWSPTSLRFAYFSGINLIIQDVGGQTWPLQIGNTSDGSQGTSLQWSSNGTTLGFSMKRQASFDIFLLSFSSGKPAMHTLVSSPSDDVQPSWSPDGRNIAFYVRSPGYDTKIAIIPSDQSRQPYIVANNVALSAAESPQWISNSELVYIEEKQGATSPTALHTVNITTGKHAAAPISAIFTP